MAIRVLLADDQHLVREGVGRLLALSECVEVVGQVNDGADVVSAIELFQPQVLLLDIRMPRMSGIDTLHELKRLQIAIPAILLTTFDDVELVLQGIKAGAKGFLLKDVTLAYLVKAIESVYEGGTCIQPVVTERILKGMAGVDSREHMLPEPENLSGKELEILRLMTGGFSNREIADCMHKSEGTIKNQVSSILAKLGVRDRTRAVLRALELGLLG